MARLRTAIVGMGWWGKVLVESVQDKSDVMQFTHAVTARPADAAAFAQSHGLALLNTYEEALADPAIDAVVLATAHSKHVDEIIAAAAAGKHVFSEKPLALELSQARRAVNAAKQAGVVLGLGNDKRFLQPVAQLRQIVESGSLGELIHLDGQYSNDNSSKVAMAAWRASADEAPGGGLTGPGLHILDALISMAGPVAKVTAQFNAVKKAPQPVDSLALLLHFRSGATGTVATVRAVPDYFRVAAFGTLGWAEVRGFDTLVIQHSGQAPVVQHLSPALAVGYLLERFALAVRGLDPFPVSTDSMLDTIAALDATIHSIRSGGPTEVAARWGVGSMERQP